MFVMLSSFYNFLLLVCMLNMTYSSPDPRGHLQSIGNHMPPIGGIEERDTFPKAKEMFDNYVKASKPVIFRKILHKGMMPAFELWTDSYLREHFGEEEIETEVGKKEKREGDMEKIKMSEFLDRYEKDNIYMVNDASKTMSKEINMPSMFTCGGYQKGIQNVIMWFSSGGTKSVLHNDGLDNINCLIDGEKYFVMFNKKYKTDIEADGWRNQGAYSEVDVEHVDLYKFPRLRNLPWYEVKMYKGDCLFIPFKWYHHVHSKVGRNFAVNIWMRHMREFNETDCKDKGQEEETFVSVSQFLQTSKRTHSQGLRDYILDETEDLQEITLENFKQVLSLTENVGDKTAEQLYSMIDNNKDGVLSSSEIEKANYDEIIKKFPEIRNILEEDEDLDNTSDEGETNKFEETLNMMKETHKVTDNKHEDLLDDSYVNEQLKTFQNTPKTNIDNRDEL